MAINQKISYILSGIGISFAVILLITHIATSVVASIGFSNIRLSPLADAFARLELVPTYFAVFTAIASFCLGIMDVRRSVIRAPRRATSFATIGTGILFFLLSGVSFTIYLAAVVAIFNFPISIGTFLAVGNFIEIIIVTGIYIAFFLLWTSTLISGIRERTEYTERLRDTESLQGSLDPI